MYVLITILKKEKLQPRFAKIQSPSLNPSKVSKKIKIILHVRAREMVDVVDGSSFARMGQVLRTGSGYILAQLVYTHGLWKSSQSGTEEKGIYIRRWTRFEKESPRLSSLFHPSSTLLFFCSLLDALFSLHLCVRLWASLVLCEKYIYMLLCAFWGICKWRCEVLLRIRNKWTVAFKLKLNLNSRILF